MQLFQKTDWLPTPELAGILGISIWGVKKHCSIEEEWKHSPYWTGQGRPVGSCREIKSRCTGIDNEGVMIPKTKPAEESEHEESQKLSKKELAREFRHEAYLRAKEYRKTDPRQIAMKEKLKEQRRDAYQQAKERNKAYRDKIKKASKENYARKRIVKREKLMKIVVPGSTIKRGNKRPGVGEPSPRDRCGSGIG